MGTSAVLSTVELRDMILDQVAEQAEAKAVDLLNCAVVSKCWTERSLDILWNRFAGLKALRYLGHILSSELVSPPTLHPLNTLNVTC